MTPFQIPQNTVSEKQADWVSDVFGYEVRTEQIFLRPSVCNRFWNILCVFIFSLFSVLENHGQNNMDNTDYEPPYLCTVHVTGQWQRIEGEIHRTILDCTLVNGKPVISRNRRI